MLIMHIGMTTNLSNLQAQLSAASYLKYSNYFENYNSIQFSEYKGALAEKVGIFAENIFKTFVIAFAFIWDITFGLAHTVFYNIYLNRKENAREQKKMEKARIAENNDQKKDEISNWQNLSSKISFVFANNCVNILLSSCFVACPFEASDNVSASINIIGGLSFLGIQLLMLGMTIYHFANDVNNVSKLSKRQFQVFKKLQPYLKNNLSSFSNLGKKISFEELTRLCEDHRKINEQFYNKWGVKKI